MDEERERGRIVLEGLATVAAAEETLIRVVYPDSFPNTRPALFAPELEIERHRDPYEGNLCVLPRASIHWRPSMTAAELVAERVPYLVELVRAGGARLADEEEPQGEPISTYLLYAPVGAIVVPADALAVSDTIPGGKLSLRFAGDTDWLTQALEPRPPDFALVGQAVLEEVRDGSGTLLASADERLLACFSEPTWPGRWVRLDRTPRSNLASALLSELVKIHPDLGRRRFHRGYEVLGCVFKDEIRQAVWEDSWFFLVLKNPGGREPSEFPIQLFRGMPYSPEVLAERIPQLAPLREATVALMGAGALGSEIVSQLAKAQCSKLKLADRDHVEAAGTVRWSDGLPAAGGLKAFVLKALMEADHPYVDIRAFPIVVGAASATRDGPSEREQLDEWIDGADMVVEATAEQNVRRVIAYLAHPLGIPQTYAWSIDAFGGIVASLIPGETGCLLCLEQALSDGRVPAPLAPEDGESVRVQPRGCADRTFTGAFVDLAPLAVEATRMTIGVICRHADGGYPMPTFPVVTAQLRDPNGAVCVPSWSGYELPPRPGSCPLCARF